MKKLIYSVFLLLASTGLIASTNSGFDNYRNGNYIEASKNLKTLIKYQNKVALFYLGKMHIYGYGKIQNTEEGIRLISKSAKIGYLPAQLFLAKYYLHIKNDPSQALVFFKKAAANNNLDAQMFTAAAYLYGYGTKKTPEKARRYYIQAAKNGNPAAQHTLAKHFLKSKHRGNKKMGMIWLKKSATKGYKPAVITLNNINNPSPNSKDDVKKAKDHTKKADPKQLAMSWIASSSPKASLAHTYRLKGPVSSWSVDKKLITNTYNMSPKLAPIKRGEIFKTDAKLTNPDDIKIAAFINTIGAINYEQKQRHLFIPRYTLPNTQNQQAAFNKTSKLAERGHPKAQFILGMMYEQGVGHPKDMRKALKYYLLSADQHYLKAEYNLGLIFLEGNGIEKNYKASLAWLEKAAFKGSAYAQYLLALIHEHGLGQPGDRHYIPKNQHYAEKMYLLSSSNGYGKAQFNLAELYSSGLLNRGKTLNAQNSLHKLTLELYESAAKQDIPEAKLALAYFYIDSKDEEKQKWAFKVAKNTADNDNPYAEFILALMYDRGIGTSQNKSKAISWYKKAVEKNNPVAEFILGSYYYTGQSVWKNKTKAINLLTKASGKDLPFADYNLAIIMRDQKSQGDYLYFLRKSAAKDYSKASLLLADIYLNDEAQPQSALRHAASIYRTFAKRGYPKAQLRLGYMYDQGIYFFRKPELAFRWYQKAARQNNALAQYQLANLYQKQASDRQTINKAISWYQKAAKQHFTPAIVALGFINETYLQEYQKAFALYEKAADDKSPEAIYNLALMYLYGKGLDANYKKAFKLFSRSAKENFSPSEYSLGVMYLYGLGARQNHRKAFKWFQKAARKGNVYAIYQLGKLSENGLGTPANKKNAMTFYKVAALKGSAQAGSAFKRLSTQ